jgi:ABC-type nitrate/sulfonate/bicarbonate transport system substrate-binding protein
MIGILINLLFDANAFNIKTIQKYLPERGIIMKKRILSSLLATVLVVGLLSGCSSSSATENSTGDTASSESGASTETTSLQLGVMTGTSEHFISLVGIEQGIYENYGINLQITEFGTGVEAVGAVTTGQIDLAEIMEFGMINRLGQTSENSNLRILAQNYVSIATDSGDDMALYVNPDKIKSLSDLKDKNISVSLGTQNEYQVAKLLEYADLSDDDVSQIPVDAEADVLAVAKKGDIDAAWANGQQAVNLQKEGWTALITAEEVGLVTRDLFVGSDTIATNTDLLANYFQARSEIVEYIQNNIDDVATFISEKTGVAEETFKTTMNSYNFENTFTQETYDSLNDLIDWSVAKGTFDAFDIDTFIVTDGLKQAFPDNVTYQSQE